ncbi:MAG: CpsD/CapB family tyrosine-protein kinase, partial [Acidobacteriota bacterium]
PSAYESLTGKLLAYRERSRNNVILVTSAVTGDGTSTVARNCATTLGKGLSQRVVLVDANLRTPSQQTTLDIARPDGLTDVLAGDVELRSAIVSNLRSGFSLLASGRSTTRPQHLFSRACFRSVLSILQTEFDWVILDTPPATTFPDVTCLAGAGAGAVLVLRAERTRWEVAEEAKNTLQRSGIEIVCAVLNRRRYHIPEPIYQRL